jgi:hypothetical protein
MPGFAESFWSSDYAAGKKDGAALCRARLMASSPGLGVLFGKLQQGVIENRQVLTIARMRAEAEEAYGQKLGDIAPAVDRVQGGFSRDDGASTRKVEPVHTE